MSNYTVSVPEEWEGYGRFCYLPVELLVVEPEVQRKHTKARSKKIADNFQRDALGVIYVIDLRNGTFAVPDGQHRWEAAKEKGYKYVPCLVYSQRAQPERGKLFNLFNTVRAQVGAGDKTRVALLSEDTDVVEWEQLLQHYGFTTFLEAMEQKRKPGQINPGVRTYLTRNFGKEKAMVLANLIFGLLRFVEEPDKQRTESKAIQGFAHFLYSETRSLTEDIDEEKLIAILCRYSAQTIKGFVEDRGRNLKHDFRHARDLTADYAAVYRNIYYGLDPAYGDLSSAA